MKKQSLKEIATQLGYLNEQLITEATSPSPNPQNAKKVHWRQCGSLDAPTTTTDTAAMTIGMGSIPQVGDQFITNNTPVEILQIDPPDPSVNIQLDSMDYDHHVCGEITPVTTLPTGTGDLNPNTINIDKVPSIYDKPEKMGDRMNEIKKLSECGPIPMGQNPQGPPMNRLPMSPMNRLPMSPMNRPPMPPMNRPPMPPQAMPPQAMLTPNQLNDPNFIARIVAQVIQQLSNSSSEEDFLNEQLGLGDHGGGHPRGGTKSDPSQLIDQTKVKIDILGDEKEVIIDRKGKGLSDVTISWDEPWGREKHNVEFEYESDEWRSGDLDGSGSEDLTVTAEVPFGPKSSLIWKFSLTASVLNTFDSTGDFEDWDWDTLEIDKVKKEYTAKDQWDDFSREEKAEVLDILGYDGNIILHNSIGYEEILDDVPNLDKEAFDAEILGIPIGEGTCGYTHQVNPKTGRRGKELRTPGGTKGMSALNRTNFMTNRN